MKVKVSSEDLPLFMRIIEYGMVPDNKYFTIKMLISELKLQPYEIKICTGLLSSSLREANPNHILYVVSEEDNTGKILDNTYEYICSLLPSAITQYNEYEEIILARKNAEEAKRQSQTANRQSIIAIGIALFFGIVQTAISLIALYK